MDMTPFPIADATSHQNRYQAADFDKLTNHRTFPISTTPDSNVARRLSAERTSRIPIATADKRSISSRRASSSTAQGAPPRGIRRDSSYSSVHEDGDGKLVCHNSITPFSESATEQSL